MRRLLIGPVAYLSQLSAAVSRAWDAFFFRPADPTAPGVVRVVVGALLLWNLGVFGLDLRAFFGADGWADPAIVEMFRKEGAPQSWSFWSLVPDGLIWPVWFVCMVVLALFMVGLWGRVTAVLAWIIVVSTARRVPVALFGFDQMVSTWTFYLAVTGAGSQAVSLDRFLKRYRQARADVARRRLDGKWPVPSGVPAPSVSANLALRLIQIHLCFIYGMAGLAKLQGGGWWSGTAVWGTLAAGEFRLVDLTWLAAYPWLINLMTHLALFFEVSYPVLIWPKVLRPLYIGYAVLMHIGIGLGLGLTEFGLAMLAGNLAFVSGPWLRSLVAGRGVPPGKVLYDGACPRCRASMALVTAADADHTVEPVDLTAVNVAAVHPGLTKDACLQAMHLVRPDGTVEVGWDACLTLARWNPLLWPLAIVGGLPGARTVGRRAYNAFAASRPRDCTDDTCGIHAHRPSVAAVAPTERTHP